MRSKIRFFIFNKGRSEILRILFFAVFIVSFLVLPPTSFAYSRTPSGSSISNPVTFTFSASDLNIDGNWGEVLQSMWYDIRRVNGSVAFTSSCFTYNANPNGITDIVNLPLENYGRVVLYVSNFSNCSTIWSARVAEGYTDGVSILFTVIAPSPPSIVTTSLSDGTVNVAYFVNTLEASGGAGNYVWSVVSGSGILPDDLSLNSVTGLISGTTTVIGTYNFTVQVTDANNLTDTQGLSITVNPVPTPVTAYSRSPSGSLISNPITFTFSTSDLSPGGYEWGELFKSMWFEAKRVNGSIAFTSSCFTYSANPYGVTDIVNLPIDNYARIGMNVSSLSNCATISGQRLIEGYNDGISILFTVIHGNTPAGSNVSVGPLSGITLIFSGVTHEGQTTVASSTSGPTPPSGFKLGSPPTYYSISTTAEFVPPVEVCINYDDTQFKNEKNLKLLHFENGQWVNVTTSLDTTNNKICGSVSSFSELALMENVSIDHIIDEVQSSNIKPEVKQGLLDKLIAAKGAIERNQKKVAVNILKAFINQVSAQKNKAITNDQADFFTADARALINQLGGNLLSTIFKWALFGWLDRFINAVVGSKF